MSFIQELKRRNVFRVVAAYVVMSWLLLQVADVASNAFSLPDWTFRFLLLILAIGLIPAAIFSWVFEITPDGIRKESEIPAGQSITPQTGRRLNYITIGMVVVGIAFVLWQQYLGPAPMERPATAAAPAQADNTVKAPAVNARSIAVLPFVNMSSDPENEYFADGLSEELLNQLAQIPDLQVAGRTSSFSFKGKNEDLREIGTTLGVANVLEGSVRRQGNQVRVTAQLIRVDDGFHLWSNTYERTMDDVFAIQDDISANVADAMKIILDESAWQHMQAVGVRNVDAFVEFQKGRELFEQAHQGGEFMPLMRRGLEHFQRAIELAPDFDAAFWHMSDYYGHVLLDSGSSDEDKDQALDDLRAVLDAAYAKSGDASRKAFIDVDRVLFSDDWSPLRDRIEKALATTGCPEPTWIEIATGIGYAEAAEEMWTRYRQCEPLSTTGPQQMASAAYWQGDFERAIGITKEAEARLGSGAWSSANRQRVLMAMGRGDEALALAPEIIGDTSFFGMSSKALPLALAGDREGALAAMEAWKASNGGNPRNELEIHAAVGDREVANAIAAGMDARAGGPMFLLLAVEYCACGALFDLEVTPNFRARINELGMNWPPPSLIDFPLKTW